MKEFTLKPMTEFVLDEYKLFSGNENQLYEVGKSAVSYAKFLSRPLELWMFVPCGDNGEPLEEPHNIGLIHTYPTGNTVMDASLEYAMKYQQAKDRVLFEGFEAQTDKEYIKIYGGIRVFVRTNIESKMAGYVFTEKPSNITIESLTKQDIKLTEAGIKEAVYSACSGWLAEPCN